MKNDKMSAFAYSIYKQKYSLNKKEEWPDTAKRVATSVLKSVNANKSLIDQVTKYITDRKFIPGGRYLAAAGKEYHQTQNCLLLRAEDSREGWSELLHNSAMALMSGAGIGVDYSLLRERGAGIKKTGGTATGPCALMQMLNECGRGIVNGGNRRSAIWAGLNWNHPDIQEFLDIKDWIPEVRAMKEKDFNFPARMDMTNVSVLLDDAFFKNFSSKAAKDVYWKTVKNMLKKSEPGFSIDIGDNTGETLRNACTEVTSADDSDICNLGSINLARIDSLDEMASVVECATAFLLAGTVYSDVPYSKVNTIREKNRRLGLGLMGIHEWILSHGKTYQQDSELDKYLFIYSASTNYAKSYADLWNLSYPVKSRAIAPTGTIGIIGETTTGIEPIYCVAFKRRYLNNGQWNYQYVVDPTAKNLIESGISPDKIEDAYTLATDVERRLAFQAHVQKYVDHAISSTINIPAWGSELNNEDTVKKFGNTLYKYLPQLRGVTVYADGSRGGQPLSQVKYETALKHEGQVFIEAQNLCDITKGGQCGE